MEMYGVCAVRLYGVWAVCAVWTYTGAGTMRFCCMAVWGGLWPVRLTWRSL